MIVRDGYSYVIGSAVVSVTLFLLGLWGVALAGIGLTAFFAYFFRDPDRETPTDERAIVSPADGKVVRVAKLDHADPQSAVQVSIFLSPFDVHVNRSPISGRVTHLNYRPGEFRPAMRDEASVVNEQTEIRIEGTHTQLVVKQIAGILARRIVCWKQTGDTVQKGERIGLIKFGSRTDLILPSETDVTVRVGDRVSGGTSVIARIKP
jgi:phosphatidylserine decarboxylase